MKKFVLFFLILVLDLLFLVSCRSLSPNFPAKQIKSLEYYLPEWEGTELPSNRIEILRFHHTVECKDCATIGHFVVYLLKKEYQKECQEGRIVYLSVNSDMLENKPLLDKFNVLEEDFVVSFVSGDKEDIRHEVVPFKLAKEGKDLTPFLRKILQEGLSKISKP